MTERVRRRGGGWIHAGEAAIRLAHERFRAAGLTRRWTFVIDDSDGSAVIGLV